MPVIPLECPSCGTELRIDSDESAAICKHCGKPFVIKEAIVLNYIKLVTAVDEKALVLKEFEFDGDVLTRFNGKAPTVVIPGNVTAIGRKAFEDCREIAEVRLPDSIKVIEEYAFAGCDNLKSIVFPETLEKIGSYAFAECSALEELELPNSVGEIGSYAFVRCYSLDSVKMPSSNSNVHETAFTGDSDVHFIWPDDWAKKQIDKLRIVAPALGGLIELCDSTGENDTFLFLGFSELGMSVESSTYFFYSYKDFMRLFSIEAHSNDPYLLRLSVENAQQRYEAISDIQKSYSELISLLDRAKISRSKIETINIPHFIWKQGKGLNYKVTDIGSVQVLQIRFIQE
ncbi:MAG: leucine-rich repeat protein [Clostridiales bacterium]|nr:leucine-rich repeat protein [Clostridiales bacterium]